MLLLFCYYRNLLWLFKRLRRVAEIYLGCGDLFNGQRLWRVILHKILDSFFFRHLN
jgi:hypothetical protein